MKTSIMQKEIIPTKANVSNTDLSKFLVVHPGEFVFNPRTHGKKIGFGYNDTDSTFIISWNNIVFRIKDIMRDKVLSEYLFFHFNRAEWDRDACYRSWGSSTEVFTWDALCEMEVLLSSFGVQQKYVDVYKSMLENQKCYETTLDDLKLTVDVILDRFKYSEKKSSMSALVEEIDNRNTENTYHSAYGFNITKQFMLSKSSSDDLSNYKIVEKSQFIFSGMQTGRDECIIIDLLTDDTPVIVSPAYTVLQTKNNNVLPEYIQMWFSRSETDRFGWFLSDASIHTNFDLDCFYGIQILLPNIEFQKAIVNIYSAYAERRKINEQLKAQIKNICPVLVRGAIEKGKV